MIPLRKATHPDFKPLFVKPEDVVELSDLSPLPADLAPLPYRVVFFFKIWALKLIVTVQLTLFNLFYSPVKNKPNWTRTYHCRPSLPVRIFLPQPLSALQSRSPTHSKTENTPSPVHTRQKKVEPTTLLPLYLNIHGGGFAVCDASVDDHFCRSWSDRSDMIVVSLNYSKAPLYPFPVPVYDVAAVARAVIDDASLPIDKSRVIIGGFSAGGNLALSASLLPELQSRIKAAVIYYPILDWSHPPPIKFGNRLYTDRPTESLAKAASFLDWGYVPARQNRRDKLLSPCYASRQELPANICMVGAQHDMLCREARDMMYALAGKMMPRQGWDQGFEDDHYKWMLLMGVKHGFTNDFGQKGKRADRRRQLCDDMYSDVHRWLVDRIFPQKIFPDTSEENMESSDPVFSTGHDQPGTVRSRL